MRDAQALGISFFAGEAEDGRFDRIVRDAWEGSLAPLYNYMDQLDRRCGLAVESPFVFYLRYVGETLLKAWRYWSVYRQSKAILDEVLTAPDRMTYADVAIAQPNADEFEELNLYNATSGGDAAVERKQRHDSIRLKTTAAAPAATTCA